ncbi:hypothetical protein MBLNU13_g03641t1 [Cladosporium sp. NU13]
MAKSAGASTNMFIVDHTDPGPRAMSEEYEEDNQWLVEAILAKRTRQGVKQYLVSWKGDWPAEEKESWVDEDDLGDDMINDLKVSGIVLKATPASKVYITEPTSSVYDDEDEMDLSSGNDSENSGSEYDPDEDEDEEDDEMDVDDIADKPASSKLPNDSSVKSDRAACTTEQHGHSSRSPSPEPASQVEEIEEMHNRALLAAEMEAQARADLEALDAAWDAHGDTFTLSVETIRQRPAMMQPAVQQPSQPHTVSQSGFVDHIFNPMVTASEDAFMDELFDFAAAVGYDFEEDAEGSVVSEGEQARYDAMSPWPRM